MTFLSDVQPRPLHITFLLDRSSSMQSIREATISGFNEYLASQRVGDGEVHFRLCEFSSTEDFATHEQALIAESADLTMDSYNPGGWSTALYDAMWRTIATVEASVAGMDADVLVVVMTDGAENSSREVTRAQVFDRINKIQAEKGWTFVYLGANQDAYGEGIKMGVHGGMTRTYAGTHEGTCDTFSVLASATTNYRAANAAGTPVDNFFDADADSEEPV